jgi:hypothetical protein
MERLEAGTYGSLGSRGREKSLMGKSHKGFNLEKNMVGLAFREIARGQALVAYTCNPSY